MSFNKRLLWVGIILAVLIAALLTVYFWPKAPTPTPNASKTVELHRFTEDEVTGVTVTRGDLVLSFSKLQAGEWVLLGCDPAELDSGYVYDTVNGAAVLTAIEKLADSVENPADYGLTTPSAIVSVALKNGNTSTLIFGNKTLDQSAYYTQLQGKPQVYLVASAVAAPFYYTPTQYLDKNIFSLSLHDVSSITVDHPVHGLFTVVRTADAEDEKTLGSWAMTTPFSKETRAQETENWIQNILGIYANDLIEGTQQREAYGLLNPDTKITVTGKDGKVESVVLSSVKDALEIRGKERIYILGEDADSFLQTAPFSLLDPFLCAVDINTLSALTWGAGEDLHTARFSESYRVDGKTVPIESFKNAYLELMMVTILAPVQASDTAVLQTPPVFSYTFTSKDGKDTAVRLYEINRLTYLAQVDGVVSYRVDAQKVKRAQNALNALVLEE